MSEKNFLNIHVLISHNPSCLNRDDMNMQKSAIFGISVPQSRPSLVLNVSPSYP